MWGIELQTQPAPDKNFTLDSIYSLNIFKLRKVIKMINKNKEKLKGYTDDQGTEKYMKYLKIATKLESIRREIAKKYGIVTLK
jgi:hypothetical protein